MNRTTPRLLHLREDSTCHVPSCAERVVGGVRGDPSHCPAHTDGSFIMCCLNGTTIYLADSSIARYSSGAVGYSLKPSAVQPQSSRALPFCRLECVPAFVVDAPTSSCAASSFEFLHVEESGQRPFSCYPLSAAALHRSLANAGGDRFRHLVRSLQNSHRHNRTLNIATIGGSVAMGAGAMGSCRVCHHQAAAPTSSAAARAHSQKWRLSSC